MGTQTVEALIEGGKATAAPPLGPALGPLGVNIGQVIAEINKKTEAFKGMQVPVTVEVDSDTKAFGIKVGTPPASSLIKKEAKIETASGRPLTEHIADLKIEQIIKIAKMKEDGLTGADMKARVKEIVGTCNSMGIMVEGKHARDSLKIIDEGKFDKEIAEEKTELTQEELKELEEEKKKLQEELKEKYEEFEKKAGEIKAQMEGKERGEIKAAMKEENIPDEIIEKLLPLEAEVAKTMAKPAGGAEE